MSKKREIDRQAKLAGIIRPLVTYNRQIKAYVVSIADVKLTTRAGYTSVTVGTYQSASEAKEHLRADIQTCIDQNLDAYPNILERVESRYHPDSDSLATNDKPKRTKQGRLLQPHETSTVIDLQADNWQSKWGAFLSNPSFAYVILEDNQDGTGFGFSVGYRTSTVTRKNKNGTVKKYEYIRFYAMVHRDGRKTQTIYLGDAKKAAQADLMNIGRTLQKSV